MQGASPRRCRCRKVHLIRSAGGRQHGGVTATQPANLRHSQPAASESASSVEGLRCPVSSSSSPTYGSSPETLRVVVSVHTPKKTSCVHARARDPQQALRARITDERRKSALAPRKQMPRHAMRCTPVLQHQVSVKLMQWSLIVNRQSNDCNRAAPQLRLLGSASHRNANGKHGRLERAHAGVLLIEHHARNDGHQRPRYLHCRHDHDCREQPQCLRAPRPRVSQPDLAVFPLGQPRKWQNEVFLARIAKLWVTCRTMIANLHIHIGNRQLTMFRRVTQNAAAPMKSRTFTQKNLRSCTRPRLGVLMQAQLRFEKLTLNLERVPNKHRGLVRRGGYALVLVNPGTSPRVRAQHQDSTGGIPPPHNRLLRTRSPAGCRPGWWCGAAAIWPC